MITLTKGEGAIKGTKTELMADLALIMKIMLDKKIADTDDLLFAMSMAIEADCVEGINIKGRRDESKNT